MKFYCIEIADGDAKIKGKSIYEYDDKVKAEASFHKKVGTAMESELYTRHQIMVIDEFNNRLQYKVFVRTVKGTEPEVTEPIVNE